MIVHKSNDFFGFGKRFCFFFGFLDFFFKTIKKTVKNDIINKGDRKVPIPKLNLEI